MGAGINPADRVVSNSFKALKGYYYFGVYKPVLSSMDDLVEGMIT
jgi:hypothetical protein